MSGRVIIGLTGNIATGKSAIMRLAAERGALTIDADRVVHELLDGDAADTLKKEADKALEGGSKELRKKLGGLLDKKD